MMIFVLLKPKITGFRNKVFRSAGNHRKRAIALGILGLCLLALLFVLSCKILASFQSVEMIGDFLARKLLNMVLLTLFSLLVFSHVISGLSNLYLSNDLGFCHATPVSTRELFVARALHSVLDSSWMLVVFGLPVFMAYAYVYRPGPSFYFSLIHLNLAMVFIAGGIGILLVMALVSVFPANRSRDIVVLVSLLMGIALYVVFRVLKPERLMDPDAFFSVSAYLSALKGTDSLYLPTRWISEALWGSLGHHTENSLLFNCALAWSTAGAVAVFNIWAAGVLYFDGFSKSQEAKKKRSEKRILMRCVDRFLPRIFGRDMGAMMGKDIRAFFRDNTQWSQLLLLCGLVVVYLYNFTALPFDMSPIRLDFLQNELAFLNMGLAGFVVSAVSARFVFPAISAEGRAYWIIQTSPLPVKRLLWGKYLFFVLPMIVLAEILVVFTNMLLEVSSFTMVLSVLTMLFVVPGIVSLGIGLGARFPEFGSENIAKVATGFGGLVFMAVSALFVAAVILLEAGPVYWLFSAQVDGKGVSTLTWLLVVFSFFLALVISVLVLYRSMKMGWCTLEDYE
jgi:ABC-2 type transport system permease protein